MNQPLTADKEKTIIIAPKDETTIIVNRDDEPTEQASWMTKFYPTASIYSAVEMLKEEQTNVHYILLAFMNGMEKEFKEHLKKNKDDEDVKSALSFTTKAIEKLLEDNKNNNDLRDLKVIELARVDVCFPVCKKK